MKTSVCLSASVNRLYSQVSHKLIHLKIESIAKCMQTQSTSKGKKENDGKVIQS